MNDPDANPDRLRIHLGVAPDVDRDVALAWLRDRVVAPLDALTERDARLYGDIGSERVWIGARRPNRFRSGKSLLRGRLERRGGRWVLAGQMRTTLNTKLSLAPLALAPLCVSYLALISSGDRRAGFAALALGAFTVFALSLKFVRYTSNLDAALIAQRLSAPTPPTAQP